MNSTRLRSRVSFLLAPLGALILCPVDAGASDITGDNLTVNLNAMVSGDTGVVGNLAVGGSVYMGGAVGVSTLGVSPKAKLSIGKSDFTNTISADLLISESSPQLMFEETGLDVGVDNRNWDFLVNAEQLYMRAVNDSNTVASTFLLVDRSGTTIDSVAFPNGNVGIGTSSPTAKLDVDGDVRIRGNIRNSAGTIILPIGSGALVTTSGTQTIAGTTTLQGTTTLGGSTAATQVKIDGSGNIGIGTATPSGKLNVSGAGQTTSNFDSYANSANYWERATLQFRRAEGTQANPAPVANINGDWLGDLQFSGYYGGVFTPAANILATVDGNLVQSPYVPAKLAFYTSDGLSNPQARMTIKGNGDVGIGKEPYARLHVSTDSTASVETYRIASRAEASLTATAAGASSSMLTGFYAESIYGASSSVGLSPGPNGGGLLVGMRSISRNNSAQTVTNVTGQMGEAWQYGTGSITNARALVAGRPWAPGAGATITNAFGLYLDEQQKRPVNPGTYGATNGYGVYQVGPSDTNYFAGKVGIGVIPAADSTTKLEVAGDLKITGSIKTSTATFTLPVNGGTLLTSGSGATLTNLNASALSSGIIPDNVLPSNLVRAYEDGIELESQTFGDLNWDRVDKSDASLADLPTRNFSDLQNLPSTLAEHGITDALTTATTAETVAGDTSTKAVTPASLKEAGYLRVATNAATGRITTPLRIERQGDVLMGEFGQ